MKKLDNLSPAKGSNRSRKRKGRGPGSGNGKTAGKGHKGQTARKGGGIAPGFEGGQMPLYKRLPKRGFKNPFRKVYNPVNLDSLNRFDSGTEITPELLDKAGFLREKGQPVKLLARGKLEKAFKVKVHKASLSAKAAVEQAGGSLEEI